MLRQAVSSQGLIRPLAPPAELPALQLRPSEIGVVKDGPVLKRWLEAQKAWMARHGRLRGEVLKTIFMGAIVSCYQVVSWVMSASVG